MAIIQPSTGGKAPIMDDDIYVVTCIDTQLIDVEEDQYNNFHKVDVYLQVDGIADEEGEPIVLKPRINQAWSEKATLFKYAIAFGIDADPSQPFDTAQMHGLQAQAQVKTEKPGDWPRVKNMVPMPKARTAAASTTPTTTRRVTGPAWINEQGDIEWKAWWAQTERYGTTKQSVAAKIGGLDKLETMSVDELADVLESLKV